MVQPGRLVIDNFMRYKHVDINLRDLGLVLFKGRNMDEPKGSSGSGKTIFGDAMMWLYGGVTSRKIPADSVIGKAGKFASVSSELFDGDVQYELARYRKHPKFENSLVFADGNNLSHRKVAKTEGRVKTIVGCSFNLLRLSSFVGGDSKLMFSRMDAASRAKILDEIVDTDEANISKRYKELSSLVRQLETELDDYERQIESEEERIVSTRTLVNSTKTDMQAFAIKVEDDIGPEPKPQSDYDGMTKQINAQIIQYTAVEVANEKIRNAIQESKLRWMAIRTQEQIHQSTLTKKQNARVNIKIGDKCHACKTVATNATLSDIQADMAKEIQQAQLIFNNVHAKAEAEKAVYQGIGVPDDNTKETIFQLRQRLNEVRQDKNDYERTLKYYKDAKDRIDVSIAAKAQQLQNMQLRITEAQKKISEHKKLISLLVLNRVKTEKRLSNVKVMRDFYSPNGYRPLVMRRYSPIISDYSNQYLTYLTGGSEQVEIRTKQSTVAGEIKDKIDISVLQHGERRSFPHMYSRGEGQAIDLAMGFGVMDLAAAKSGKQFGFRYFDESFDGLPMELVDRFFGMLTEKIYKKGMTIICTAHRPLPERYFSHVFESVKEKGVCRLEILK